MGKYIGPTCKIAARLGDLSTKRDISKKRHSFVEGGGNKKRSEYAIQLIAKQKIRFTYFVRESKFRSYFKEACRLKGPSGYNLLLLLESRLDNIVWRLGFASTRKEARQMVNHKHVMVNGKIVNISSYNTKLGDVISLVKKCSSQERVIEALSLSKAANYEYSWLSVDKEKLEGTYVAYPKREELPMDLSENLVIEFYSR